MFLQPCFRLGYNIKKAFKEEELYKDRESQIQAINRTFEDVQKPVTEHYSKPGVFATQEMYIYPDYEVVSTTIYVSNTLLNPNLIQLWRYPFAQVIFDGDPAPVDCPQTIQVEKMSNAVIRQAFLESITMKMTYFLNKLFLNQRYDGRKR